MLYGGSGEGEEDTRQCGECERWANRANYARHMRKCERAEHVVEERGGWRDWEKSRGSGLLARRVRCGRCGMCGER